MVPKIYTRALMVMIVMLFSVVGFAQKDCNLPSTFIANYDVEVTPTGTWTTTSTSVASGDCKVYKVNMTIGQEYTFKTGCDDGATCAFDSFMEVYNSTGGFIMSDDDGCPSYRSKATWTATETVAYVKVRGYNVLNFGAYTMAYKSDAPVIVTANCKTAPDFDYTISASGSWQTHPASGTIALASLECAIYKVTGITADTYYTFKTGCDDGATADFDTEIEVYNASGVLLAANDDACTGWTSLLDWTSPGTYTGTIYVKVKGWSNRAGDYRMAYRSAGTVSDLCKTAPDFDETITPSISWQTFPATLTETVSITSGACDIYKVTGITASTGYTFKTGCDDGATANFDTFIELYDADGNFLGQNDDGCAQWTSILIWTAPGTYSGTVYVKVRGYNDEKTGTYRMAYIKGAAAPPSACLIPPLFSAAVTPSTSWAGDSQTLAQDACYIYKVNATIGNLYTFKTGCGPAGSVTPTASFDTYLELYDADGNWLSDNDDGCEQWRSSLSWTAAGTVTLTTYFVKVRGWNSNNYGPYTIAYSYGAAPASTCKTPPTFDEALAAPTTGWQTGGSDATVSAGCYVYQVKVTTGKTYTFKTGCGDGASAAAGFDTFMELYDATGVWLAQDDDGCKVPASDDYTSKIEYSATYTGDAFIKVRGYNSEDYGAFTLAYRDNGPGPDALQLGTGEDLLKNQVKVYPNPANHSFTVASERPLSFTRLTLSEFTGRVVRSWNLDQPTTSLRIESTGYAQGVYILSIETSEGWIRKKVSIIR